MHVEVSLAQNRRSLLGMRSTTWRKPSQKGADWSQVNTDYDKFFDKLDPDFFAHLNLAMGIPSELTLLFQDLYNNIERRFRIGRHNGGVIQHDGGD